MDQPSIVDHRSVGPVVERKTASSPASRPVTASVSAGIAAANAHLPHPGEPEPRFPGEDAGRSLAEMAHRDLDAALQLLAERAQYITGASGAAIALRRGEHNDMLCRASVGSNAPDLGALLSMEYGLSGESVRTRQTLRCDDTERDARVNREGCRQLGIASVAVMPIVGEEQVLGVFELFSGKPRAFDERDISALQRLSEMVETAVKHAVAARSVPEVKELPPAEPAPLVNTVVETAPEERSIPVVSAEAMPSSSSQMPLLPAADEAKLETPEAKPQPAPKKPVFWSAAGHAPASAAPADEAREPIAVPPVLRSLQKCQACGFPVSQGRTFCVECEEKQWRGQRLAKQGIDPSDGKVVVADSAVASRAPVQNLPTAAIEPTPSTAHTSAASSSELHEVPAEVRASDDPTLFLSSAVPPESWLVTNKYILGSMLLVAIIVGVIAWLR
jgi:hypothetical protein